MDASNKYSIPKGYNTTRLILRSLRYFRRNTINAITINMEKFGDTYSVVFPGNRLIVVTRDLPFIQHVLRDNHTNYHKSKHMVDKIGKLFGNGLLFSSGSYWLQQRRLIQPGFHMKKLQGLYSIVAERIETLLASFPSGQAVNVYPAIYQIAFNIILRSLSRYRILILSLCVKNDYINAVINESMRLRPAAFMTDRMALSDDSVGQWAYPKDTVILSFFYGVHRSKDHWEDPDAFIPERFLEGAGKLRKMPAFFPFGAGPRLCIGNNFAMTEMCFFVHAFFRHFTISSTGQEPVMMPLITLRPDKVVLKVWPIPGLTKRSVGQ